jgi:hypothetical protein
VPRLEEKESSVSERCKAEARKMFAMSLLMVDDPWIAEATGTHGMPSQFSAQMVV